LGFIFAYFGEGPPPPFVRWPEFEQPTLASHVAMIPCNYFQSAENIVDDTHVHFAHRGSEVADVARRTMPRVRAEETPYGMVEVLQHPDRIDRVHFVMPNQCFLSAWAPVPDGRVQKHRVMFWYVPIDDERHLHFRLRVRSVGFPVPEEILAKGATPAHEE